MSLSLFTLSIVTISSSVHLFSYPTALKIKNERGKHPPTSSHRLGLHSKLTARALLREMGAGQGYFFLLRWTKIEQAGGSLSTPLLSTCSRPLRCCTNPVSPLSSLSSLFPQNVSTVSLHILSPLPV